MGFTGGNAVPAVAAVAAAALVAGTVTSCSSGGSATVEGIDVSACKALSQQVSNFRWVEQSSGTNVNAGALRHSPGDQ